MRLFGDNKPDQPLRWWSPFLNGLACSFYWALAFAVLNAGGGWARIAPLPAFLAILGTAALTHSAGASLRIRGRVWLGAALFGLGHIPALGLAHAYIWTTAAPAYPLLLLYLAAFPAIVVYLAARISARWPRLPTVAVVPFLWVAAEYLRGEWLLGGYPWYLLGHTLTPEGGPTLLAPYIGVYGCSLLLALIVCAVHDAISRFKDAKEKAQAFGVAVFVLWAVSALVSIELPSPPTSRTFRVAVLQTNLPQDNKIGWSIADRVADHTRWLKLTEQAATKGQFGVEGKRPQLVVWPETMFPGQALNPQSITAQRNAGLTFRGPDGKPLDATWFADSLLETQARLDVPFLVGAIAADGLRFSTGEGGRVRTDADARTNSAILVTDGRPQAERYDKMDLMAFGEYIPLVHRWPAVQNWLTGLGAHGMSFDLAFGTSRTLFNVEGVRIGTPICFEVCHEKACREFTTTADGARRADLLINLTNDGWFYTSDFNRRMHLLQARWRCAETATPMVRAANTGISAAIDARGKLLTTKLDDGQPTERTEGLLTAEVPLPALEAPTTFYAKAGHHLNTLIAIAGAALTLLAFWPKRRAA